MPPRPVLKFSHRGQAFRPGATQQLQQKCLGLVILMMCGEQKIRVQTGKNTLTLTPRSGLDARCIVKRNLYMMNV